MVVDLRPCLRGIRVDGGGGRQQCHCRNTPQLKAGSQNEMDPTSDASTRGHTQQLRGAVIIKGET